MANAPSERLIERALALVVQGEVAPEAAAASAQDQLRLWRQKSSQHDAAVREAMLRWSVLAGMAQDLRTHFEEPQQQLGAPGTVRRRALLSIAALLGVGALAGKGVHWHWQQPVFAASYRTRTAQLLKVALLDGPGGGSGSQLDLAPLSAIDVRLHRQRRSVTLASGTVRFNVARDAERPFEVLTREARIEVVGTAFTVRDRGGAVSVSVERGQVRVHLQGGIGTRGPSGLQPVVDLLPGQAIDIRDGHAQAVQSDGMETLAAWQDGWLVFDNHPLAEALATINAYRDRPIAARDAQVGALRLTGRFRANDSAGLVAALPSILPLVATPRANGSIELRMR